MIDFHTHIGRFGKKPTDGLTAVELVRKMDGSGIDMSVVLPLNASPYGWYLESANGDILRECNRFPDRLIPFCQLDPRFGDNNPETDFSDILQEYKQRGCRGVGEIISNLYFDDPLVLNLFQHCGHAGMPVVFHVAHCIGGTYGLVDDNGLPRLEKALQACPDTVFIAHGPAWWSEMGANVSEDKRGGYPREPIDSPGRVADLMAKYQHLYGDLSAGSGYNALTRTPEYGYQFMERFQDRLLFATDTMRHIMTEDNVPIIPYFRRLLSENRISAAVHHKITHANAASLLGIDA